MWPTLLTAFALMLLIEGLLPFIAPKVWRETFRRIIDLGDGQIRFIGLSSIVVGMILAAGCCPNPSRTFLRSKRAESSGCVVRFWMNSCCTAMNR